MKVNNEEQHWLIKKIALAGAAGGLAEVLWVATYGSLTSTSSTEVARQVTATLIPAAVTSPLAPAFGVVIHFALSLALAFAFAALIWVPFVQRRGVVATVESAVMTLALVWAVNFLIVLPAWNSSFVLLLPYAATLLSKVLFGVVMAAVLAPLSTRRQRQTGQTLAGCP